MKIDLYTKLVLTVIAVCLVILALKDTTLVSIAHAQVRGPVPVNIVEIDGKGFGALDVSSIRPALPVKVKE